MKKLAELVFIPCTGRGHIASTIEFAKLLVARDSNLSITVLIIKLPLDPNLAAYADTLSAAAASDRLKFLDISSAPAKEAPTSSTSSFVEFLDSFVKSHKLRVRDAVAGLAGRSASASRLAGFVVDALFTSSLMDVADEFAVPSYVFWTSAAGWIGLNFHLRALRNEHGVDPRAELSNLAELAIPGFRNPVPVSVLPGTVFDEASLAMEITCTTRMMTRTKGIVVNTLAELEPNVLRRLISDAEAGKCPPVYAVGPILNLTGEGDHAFSDGSWSAEAAAIAKWLDDQPPRSVIYLSFGSLGSFGRDQVKEIASALERTGFRFLWTLRKHSLGSDKLAFSSGHVDAREVLPEGFLDRTAAVGRATVWAPQAAVLAHVAVGGFVSHCGWNSVLESLWFGVPIATLPLFAEQQLNAFEMVAELGLAVEVKMDYRAGYDTGVSGDEAVLVSAEEIEAGMRRVMEGDSEVRKRVREMSEKCRKAVMEGGSSYSSLDCFVSDVFENFHFQVN